MNAFAHPERNRTMKTLFCIITAWSNYDITVDLCKAGAIQQLRGGKFEQKIQLFHKVFHIIAHWDR